MLVCPAVGTGISTVFLPVRKMGRIFFILTHGLVLILLGLGLWSYPAEGGLRTAYIRFLLFYLILWTFLFVSSERFLNVIVYIQNGLAFLYIFLGPYDKVFTSPQREAFFLIFILSSLTLGFITVTMITGHWYLVRFRLPIRILIRMSRGFLIVLHIRVFTGIFYLADAWTLWKNWFDPVDLNGVLFLQRIGFGFFAPLVFSWMIDKTSRLRSTQSATGILYATMVLLFAGEMIGYYFWVRPGLLH